jgi:hypothetical protein
MSLIPTFRKQKQEDLEFKASLGYIARTCLKKNKNKNKVTKSKLEKDR